MNWKIESDGDSTRLLNAQGEIIGEVWSEMKDTDARAMSAAPELVKACIAMFEARWSTWHRFAEENETLPLDMQLGHDAVMKATGEQLRTA